MRKISVITCAILLLFGLFCGCMKSQPLNAFPGTEEYNQRVASFAYTPDEAYEEARKVAKEENKLQYLSKRPTALRRRWYIFSFIQTTGANLQGYHVNGDTGEVVFFSQDRTISSE